MYDLLLGEWLAPETGGILITDRAALSYDGQQLLATSADALSAGDSNGSVLDVYHVRMQGDGLFGGSWQGGFE